MFSAFRNTMGMTPTKRIARAATLGVGMLIGGGISAPTAQANLIGAQVTYDYLFPDTSTVHFSLPTQTITSSTSLVDTINSNLTTTFTNNEIIITSPVDLTFTSASTTFNGPSYLFSGVTISSVTIDPASSAAFAGVPSFFTANDVMANFAGLHVPGGAQLILDVNSTSAIPEPASMALLAVGLAGLGMALRLRRA